MSIKFYMQRDPIAGVTQTAKDLEVDFEGLKILETKGEDSYGKPKIHVESYSETDELRVYVPETVMRDNPDVTFKIAFIGEKRRDIYHLFVQYITGHKLTYWSNLRNRKVRLILLDVVEPSDDVLVGNEPHLIVPIKFKNLNGQSQKNV
ncbi:MAG: hypothetical protein ACRCX5_14460 [Bacteroidales bacterium]